MDNVVNKQLSQSSQYKYHQIVGEFRGEPFPLKAIHPIEEDLERKRVARVNKKHEATERYIYQMSVVAIILLGMGILTGAYSALHFHLDTRTFVLFFIAIGFILSASILCLHADRISERLHSPR